MALTDKLQIYLITYNRAYWLERTLKQLFADNSPIKDCNIVILNNNSSDDTQKVIEKYQKRFSNIKYVTHKVNVGGNANICRAFEMAASCGREYFWVLCDDDYYDWTNWNAVECEMEKGVDCIGVARYVIPDDKLSDLAYQFFQLTFVPAGIYKTSNITDTIMTNMYDTICTMFQQNCVAGYLINNNKKIVFLENKIIENGANIKDNNEPQLDASYSRGANYDDVNFIRLQTTWLVGYARIINILKNKKIAKQALICGIKILYELTGLNFYKQMYKLYTNNFNIFIEIFSVLPIKYKLIIIFRFLFNIKNIFSIDNSMDKKYKLIKVLYVPIKWGKK